MEETKCSAVEKFGNHFQTRFNSSIFHGNPKESTHLSRNVRWRRRAPRTSWNCRCICRWGRGGGQMMRSIVENAERFPSSVPVSRNSCPPLEKRSVRSINICSRRKKETDGGTGYSIPNEAIHIDFLRHPLRIKGLRSTSYLDAWITCVTEPTTGSWHRLYVWWLDNTHIHPKGQSKECWR